MNKLNPWRHGDLSESIVKLESAGGSESTVAALRALLAMLSDIETRLSQIEAEDARHAAATEAAGKLYGCNADQFRKSF